MTGPGELLGGRYRLDEWLGAGGMADVFRGWDLRLGRPIAIKILKTGYSESPVFRKRFQREARHSAALNHAAIVAVYDTGDDVDAEGKHLLFIVMELVEGRTLRQVLTEERSLPWARAVSLVAEVCLALDFSHQRGIVHRDVKPANVMITSAGQVKVMDFGIAVALTSSPITPSGGVIGTAFYLSPEQANGATVDRRSDVYSIGCLLFETLCGEPPFVCANPVAVAFRHITEPPPSPAERNSSIPEALGAIVVRALAKNPDDRQQSAAALRDELLGFLASGALSWAGSAAVYPLPIPALFPGSSPLMTRTEVDDSLVVFEAEHDKLTLSLYVMESHPGNGLAVSEGDREAEARAASEMGARIQALWSLFSVFSETLNLAREIRARRARLGRGELVELTWVLRGASIAVSGHAGAGERISLGALRERIEGECTEIVSALDRLTDVRREARAVEERRAAERAEAVAAIKESIVERVQALQDVLARVDRVERAAGRACATAQVKIAESGVVSPEPRFAELRSRLLGLADVAGGVPETDETDLLEVSDSITEVESEAAEALAEATSAESAARGLLARRDELRGRVRAYHAMAIRLGLGEDQALTELYRRARDLLWQAPCDLAEATVAVLVYQQRIRGEREPR